MTSRVATATAETFRELTRERRLLAELDGEILRSQIDVARIPAPTGAERQRARWVADEQWHPQQQGRWLDDGSYELRIPYREPRELVMDVMRQGASVEVVSPPELRDRVADELRAGASRYR